MRRQTRLKPYFGIILISLVILAGCNMPGKGDISDFELMETAARETVSANLTQAVRKTENAPTVTQEAPPSDEVSPTFTPTLTTTPPQPATSTPTPCNWAAFVSDVTYADNTQVIAGSNFTKTWRLKNIGTCAWSSGYRLIFSQGDRMDAPNDAPVTAGVVNPGEMVDVSVNLVAPAAAGTYQGNFLLRSSDSVVFGIGSSANDSFWVKVVVVPPDTPTPTPTATPTPTPTPGTPDFTLSYENVHDCGGTPYATTRVDNVGDVTFESVQIHIEDVTASSTLYGPASNNVPYMSGANDCPPAASTIAPGGTAYIAASIAGYTSGNTARETLIMCTEDALGGTCITKTVDFVLP